MNFREQVDRWVSQGLAWVARKLFAQILGSVKQPSPQSARKTRTVIPLHRDPWCSTYVSAEISVPLEQSGQVLHFCSEQCRARYQGSAKRAARA